MAQKKIQITLTNSSKNNKCKSFVIGTGKKGLVRHPYFTERGFGQSQTDSAYIEVFNVSGNSWTSFETFSFSGDAWRFFEGTLGLESLYEALTDDKHISRCFFLEFTEQFQNYSNDELALVQWNKLVSESNL